jgi:hypothetical protein
LEEEEEVLVDDAAAAEDVLTVFPRAAKAARRP